MDFYVQPRVSIQCTFFSIFNPYVGLLHINMDFEFNFEYIQTSYPINGSRMLLSFPNVTPSLSMAFYNSTESTKPIRPLLFCFFQLRKPRNCKVKRAQQTCRLWGILRDILVSSQPHHRFSTLPKSTTWLQRNRKQWRNRKLHQIVTKQNEEISY